MANLSKQQVIDIINNAPKGTTPAGIVAGLRQQEHVLEGYPTQTPQNVLDVRAQTPEQRQQRRMTLLGEQEQLKKETPTGGVTPLGFIKELPGAALTVGKELLYRQPAKFLASAAQAIGTKDSDIRAGLKGEKPFAGEIKLPGIDPFQTYQAEYQANLDKGMGLDEASAIAITDIASGGASLLGLAEVASKLAQQGEKLAPKVIEKIKNFRVDRNVENAANVLSPTSKDIKLQAIKENTLSGKSLDDPTKRALKLGEDLKDVLTEKPTNIPGNLKNIHKAMSSTENTLKPLLENDNTPIIKQAFADGLDDLKTQIPRQWIKDPTGKAQFEDVIDYAKELANKSNPNIKGFRVGRTNFDNQTAKEFSTVFKGDYVNEKTAAGKAIKLVRDYWNNYLYNTAKEGTKIKQLIGKEASLYQGLQIVAEKAVKFYGKNWFMQTLLKHPTITTLGEGLAAGAALKAGYNLLKK